jgi:hypothetical protein
LPAVDKVHKARRGPSALRANKVRLVRKDLKGPPDLPAPKATPVLGARLGRPDPKAFLGLKAPLAPSAHKGPRE